MVVERRLGHGLGFAHGCTRAGRQNSPLSTWSRGATGDRAQTFVCADAGRALRLSVEAHVRLLPMTSGQSLTISAWVREDSECALEGMWFSSYQRASCGDSVSCKDAVGLDLDSHGWVGIGHHPQVIADLENYRTDNWDDMHIPGATLSSDITSKFWRRARQQWLHMSFVFSECTVSVYTNGRLHGEGVLAAPVPRILRSENVFGGPFDGCDGSSVAFGDFRAFDRSISELEAAALHAEPAGQCCISAGLRSTFGVGDVDLTGAAMSTIGRPTAVRVRPDSAQNDTKMEGSAPCSQLDAATSAGVRELDICSDITTIEDYDGLISDGVGPYIARAHCAVHLKGYSGQYRLPFQEFELEANRDFLAVHDGSSEDAPLLGRYTGTEPPGALRSSGSDLFLRFTSNDNIQTVGFRAAFHCDGDPVVYWKPSDVATHLTVGTTEWSGAKQLACRLS